MEKMNRESFCSASTFPAKLLKTKIITDDNKIIPYHFQIYPNNSCNQNCPYCSCSDEDRTKRLSFEQIKEALGYIQELGCKAITFSGGGEVLLHPDIEEIIKYTSDKGFKIGLVTNGIIVNKPSKDMWDCVTWCRISHDDYRPFTLEYKSKLEEAISKGKKVDWAFSYVLTRNPNYKTLVDIINFSNTHNFTHIRIVSDILDKETPSMNEVENNIKNIIDDSLVIYQGRKKSKHGIKKCLLSLLKPVLAADGKIYGCCGSQYAIKGKEGKMPIEHIRGEIKDIPKIFSKQIFQDGSICDVCFYEEYNKALEIITKKLKHEVFV